MDASIIQKISIWILPVLLAISIHEAAHAWMAHRKGDTTALMLGRLTFNPLKHIDPIGSILVPGLMIAFTGFAFGWAKPVPINVRNLKNPKEDMMWIALAGPMSNLIMAIIWAILLAISVALVSGESSMSLFFLLVPVAGISINVILCVLNLIPLPPLDGSRILSAFLSPKASIQYNKIEPYGFMILIALMFTGILSYIIYPIVAWLMMLLASIAGLDMGMFYGLLSAIY